MRKTGLLTETLELRVAFHDVDSMAVVWHGHYLKYLENARWALMDRIGHGYADMVASGFVWPIIESHLRHVRAARFGDQLRIQASLVEWETRLAVNYLVVDAADGARVARGRTVQVAVDGITGEMQFRSPPGFLHAVEAALAAAARAP